MPLVAIMIGLAVLFGFVWSCRVLLAWGKHWGATPAEGAMPMAGDVYLAGGPRSRLSMTRAISLSRPPEVVWPWLAQIGRGAGWYSYDLLDNGGKTSARHILTWIPAPQLGDATIIGYLRHLEPGRELVWWLAGEKFWGACASMAFDLLVTPAEGGSRLVVRISATARGVTAPLALWVFAGIDTIMARRQLLGIKERVERYANRTGDPDHPETGQPDQYQAYGVLYASGQTAGSRGLQQLSRWRQLARADGVIGAGPEVKAPGTAGCRWSGTRLPRV